MTAISIQDQGFIVPCNDTEKYIFNKIINNILGLGVNESAVKYDYYSTTEYTETRLFNFMKNMTLGYFSRYFCKLMELNWKILNCYDSLYVNRELINGDKFLVTLIISEFEDYDLEYLKISLYLQNNKIYSVDLSYDREFSFTPCECCSAGYECNSETCQKTIMEVLSRSQTKSARKI